MTALLRLSAAIDRMNAWLGRGVAWLVLLMVLIGAWNALARYGGRYIGVQLGSNTWLEAQWYLFSLVFLLGAAWALQRDAHVRVDVLYGRLGPRGKAWLDLAGGLLFLLPFCVFGIWISIPTIVSSWQVWEMSPDPGGLPRYPIKTAIPIAFALLLAQGVSEVIKRIAFLRGHSESE